MRKRCFIRVLSHVKSFISDRIYNVDPLHAIEQPNEVYVLIINGLMRNCQ